MGHFSRLRVLSLTSLAVLAFSFLPGAFAQTNSNIAQVQLTATLTSSLTIAATPNNATIHLVSGTKSAAVPISITTNWVLSGNSGIEVDAYFQSATAALTGSTASNVIPSSAVFGTVSAGAAGTGVTPQPNTAGGAFTATGKVAGAIAGATFVVDSLQLASSGQSGKQTDTLNLGVDGTYAPLAADTYTGTLYLRAQAN